MAVQDKLRDKFTNLLLAKANIEEGMGERMAEYV